MSNQCGFCDTKTDTNMMMLGNQWFEFCSSCGDTEVLTNNQTGETATVSAVFTSIGTGTAVTTTPKPVIVPVEGCFLNGQVITRNYDDYD